MEEFKIDLYTEETGDNFPKFESLNLEDAKNKIKALFDILQIEPNHSSLYSTLINNLKHVDKTDDYTYDIKTIFDDFQFDCENELLIIWDEFHIDKMSSIDIINNWDFIWYGDSDDAIILYSQINKRILLITHYGRIYYN